MHKELQGEVVKKHMVLVSMAILEVLPNENVCAIILYGSFGRNEGRLIKYAYGMGPQNDYDLMVVVENGCEPALNNQLKVKDTIQKKLPATWVDITYEPVSRFRKAVKTQVRYDIRYYSKVIYGPENIAKEIPPFAAHEIPSIEAERLISTRMWCLIGVEPLHLFKHGVLCANIDQNLFFDQMAKAILAVADSKMIIAGKYQTCYSDKLAAWEQTGQNGQKICELLAWAIRLKQQGENTNNDAYKLYHDVLAVYVENMRFVKRHTKGISLFWQRVIYGTRNTICRLQLRAWRAIVMDVLQQRVLIQLNRCEKYNPSLFERSLMALVGGTGLKSGEEFIRRLAEMRLK